MMKAVPTKLSLTQQIAVANVMQYEGYQIIKSMLENRVILARDEVVKIAPDDPQRKDKLEALQLYAYGISRLYAEFIRDVEYQAQAAAVGLEEQTAVA